MPCLICGSTYNRTVHHVYSKGAHGVIDVIENLMPLCWPHHQDLNLGIHSKGMNYFHDNYSVVRDWLEKHGWERCPITNKWFNQRINDLIS